MWEEPQGSGFNQAGGNPKERVRTPWQEPLLGVRVQYTSKRHERILLVHLNVPKSQKGEPGGELVKGTSLITLVHLVRRVAHRLFVGMLRHQGHMNI